MISRAMRSTLAAALALLLSGCIELTDHLTINPDGSRSGAAPQALVMMMEAEGADGRPAEADYPPIMDVQVRRLFPGDAFEVETDTAPADDDQGPRFVATVRFTDINKLLQTPYARARALSVDKDDAGRLVLGAATGLQALGAVRLPTEDDGQIPEPARKAAAARGKVHATYRLTLAAAPESDDANVAIADRTATWTIDGPALNDLGKLSASLRRVMTVRAPDAALQGEVTSPVRLAIAPFDELQSGAAGEAPEPIDRDAVLRALKVTPLAMKVSRSFDLAGDGFIRSNDLTLLVAVSLPRELQPQRWGGFTLDQIADDRGNDLKFSAPRAAGDFYSPYGHDDEDPTLTIDGRPARIVSVSARPPAIEARAIRTLRGSLDAFFTGVPFVVKIQDAVPASAIQRDDAGVFHRGGESPGLTSPSLTEVGGTVRLRHASSERGFTTILLDAEHMHITDIQVFDRHGRAWPTMRNRRAAAGSLHTMVVGEPEPPLAIALVVSGGGSHVTLPVALSDIPLFDDDTAKQPEDQP